MIIAKSIESAISRATPRQLLNALEQQNPDLMIEHVLDKYKGRVNEMVVQHQRKPIGFEQLEFRFKDTNGISYYGFSKDMPLPIERFGKMRDFMQWMTTGVSPDEFEMIIDACDKAWVATLKTNKNHNRVGLLLSELRLRMKMVVHTDLLYNFMACQWIREDESPDKFDASIQDEKVSQFKKDTSTGNTYFFFHQPELRQLRRLWNFTPNEWVAYWQDSERKQAFLKESLRIILSEIELQNETKILTPD